MQNPVSVGAATLNLLGRKFRQGRPLFNPPPCSVRSHGPAYAEIWFPSGGCHLDALGECTACNYGRSRKVSAAVMIEAVKAGLGSLPAIPRTLWVSAFNVLDDREVPPEARRGIFTLLQATTAERILIETHPLTVCEEKIRELQALIPGKSIGIEIGVETMGDFPRKWCVNKRLTKQEIRRAIAIIQAAGAIPYVNLLIGAPFLSASESLRDISTSIDSLLALGVRDICLFPVHVKEFTVVERLARLDLYDPLPLWALVEVILSVEPENRRNLHYSWVSDVDHPGKPASIPPQIGAKAHDEVLALLQSYLATRDERQIARLIDLSTPCRYEFRARLRKEFELPLPQRVLQGIEVLCREALPSHFDHYREELTHEMTSDWELVCQENHQPIT